MPSIILNGELGQIEANNIILGTSATIKEYIQMGNSYIYNPNAKDENTNTSSNKFISVKDDSGSELISLTNNGDLKVGNIEIIGSTSEMSIGEISFNGISSIIKGKNFNITPELASFNQIAITNGIFKTGEIQSLGGAMLFKPVASCKIEGTKIIEIDGAEVNERNNWVITDGSWVILSKFNQESTNPMRLSWDETTESFNIISNEDLSDYDTITYYCTIDNNGNIRDNLIIGVNSGNSSISIDNSEILVPKAISFKEI
ncbi:MAG: hypothetical protein IJD46_01090 [Bacilli bacterium]|nr:hypothetical protein [Bacilli bacterium]